MNKQYLILCALFLNINIGEGAAHEMDMEDTRSITPLKRKHEEAFPVGIRRQSSLESLFKIQKVEEEDEDFCMGDDANISEYALTLPWDEEGEEDEEEITPSLSPSITSFPYASNNNTVESPFVYTTPCTSPSSCTLGDGSWNTPAINHDLSGVYSPFHRIKNMMMPYHDDWYMGRGGMGCMYPPIW